MLIGGMSEIDVYVLCWCLTTSHKLFTLPHLQRRLDEVH
jgi:hypothetical protein